MLEYMSIFGLDTSNSIQIILAFITSLAVVASLCIAAKDRKNAQDIAAKDRRLNQLHYRLDILRRLHHEVYEHPAKPIDTTFTGSLILNPDIALLGERVLPRTCRMLKGEHCHTNGDGIIDSDAETKIIREEIETAISTTSNKIAELTKV